MKKESYTISSLLLVVWQDEDVGVYKEELSQLKLSKGVLESHVYIYNKLRCDLGV